jgi:ubiquitin-protein ligase
MSNIKKCKYVNYDESENVFKHVSNDFKILVNIGEYINIITDVKEINYYIYLSNVRCIENFNYDDIVSNKLLNYDETILKILFNYKTKDVIISKLYNYVLKNNKKNEMYIFNYNVNKNKLYDTPIASFYINNAKLFKFIVEILINLLNHANVNLFYENKPTFISSISNKIITLVNNRTESIDVLLNNISIMIHILDNIDYLFKNDNKYMFDIEKSLFENNILSYYIILNSLIKFNKFHLEEIKIKNIDKITIYKIEYNDKSISDKFDVLLDNESFNIGWHGSNILNWYSILYNGLKSGGEENVKIVNGTAYGTGIYMSDSCIFSSTYSNTIKGNYTSNIGNNVNNPSITPFTDLILSSKTTPKTTLTTPNTNRRLNTYNCYANNIIIMGLFQVKGGLHKYKKNTNIYVVKENKDICMRYLVVGKYNDIHNNSRDLDNYFIKKDNDNKDNNKKVMTCSNGRILKEIMLMERYNTGVNNDNSLNMSFAVEDDNVHKWICKLHKDNFKEINLYNDMITYGIDYIIIKVLLTDKYPFDPPFIHIISPILNNSNEGIKNENITNGGSICMDLLTKQHWLSSICIDKIILMIKQYILDNNLSINTNMIGKEYSYNDAVESYNNILVNKS